MAGAKRRRWTKTLPGRSSGSLTNRRPALQRSASTVPYAELHCHSNFSFLDGASHPEELAEEAARLGLEALAITDHDGFYGVVRFAEAARAVGLPTVFGAELSLALTKPQNGMADPEGTHLVVLARDPQGYAQLARAISQAQMRSKEKGKPIYERSELCALHTNHWLVLTGCRKGTVPLALEREGPAAAARALADLVACFGRDNVAVELWDHGAPLDSARNDALVDLAIRAGVDVIATNNVHYATPRHRGSLPRWPQCGRDVRSIASTRGYPRPLPRISAAASSKPAGSPVTRVWSSGRPSSVASWPSTSSWWHPTSRPGPSPTGYTEMSWLRHLTYVGAERRYGTANRRAGSRRVQADRLRARHDRDVGLRRVLPHRLGHLRVLPAIRHLLPGPRLGRQQRCLLRARRHQCRRSVIGPALRTLPVGRA